MIYIKKYVYYKYELKVGEKNDEEERQWRVGNDDSQEDAYCGGDFLPA
jgi:hypothetical protein